MKNDNRLNLIRRRGALIIICSFLLMLTGCFGFLNTKEEENSNENTTKAEEIQTNSSTDIEYVRYYTKTKTETIENGIIKEKDVGVNKEAFASNHPQWSIDNFSEEKIVLRKEIESYPSGYYKISTLKTAGEEYVTVYSFNKDGEAVVLQMTDTLVSLLDSSTIKSLRKGIIVKGEENLYKKLENYVD